MMRMLKNIFLISGFFLAGLILLTSLFLILMPYAVSSASFKNRIASVLENRLQHPVEFDNIDWSWRRGITVSGVSLRDHPDFSDNILAAADHIHLDIDWLKLISARLVFDARVAAPRINIIRAIDGRINIVDGFTPPTSQSPSDATEDGSASREPSPTEDITAPHGAKPAKSPSTSFTLPVDVSGTLAITDFSLELDDRQAGRHIAVADAGMQLDIDSIQTETIRLALHADLAVDREPLPRSLVSIIVSDLVDHSGRLTVDNIALNADIALPGLAAKLAGDMQESGIRGEITADLKAIADAAYLFTPDLADQMRPAGRLHFTVEAAGMPDAPILFDVRISGDDLGFTGSLIGNRSISSGNIRIHAAGNYDSQNAGLVIDTGNIRLLENTGMDLSGRLSGLTSDDPSADVALASLTIDIDELTHFLTDFMPDMIRLPGGKTEAPALFSVRNLSFSGGLKRGPAQAACENVSLMLPGLVIAPPDTSNHISIANGRIDISGIRADLATFFPVSVSLEGAVSVDALEVISESRNLSVKNINLDKLGIHGDGIRWVQGSPLAAAGTFALKQSLNVGSISVGSLVKIDRMRQAVDIVSVLDPDGTLTAAVDALHLDINRADISSTTGKRVSSGFRLDAALPEFTLTRIDPVSIDISGLQAEMALENAVSLSLTADAADNGRSMIRGRARLKTDLGMLTEKGRNVIGDDITGSGMVDLTLEMDGKLPDENSMANLAALKTDGNLDFITSLAITALLTDGRVGIRPDGKDHILISGMSGAPLLSYSLKGASGDGKLLCRWRLEHIDGIPKITSPSPLFLHLVIEGAHRYLSAIDLNQRLDIDSIGIRQVLAVSLDGLDYFLTSDRLTAPYAYLSRMGAEISAGIDAEDLSQLETIGIEGMPDMDLDGSFSARTGLHLIPGNRVSGNLRIDLHRANVNLPNLLEITNANTDIDLFKSYRLVILDSQNPDNLMESDLLSRRVLQPETLRTRRWSASDNSIYRHMKQLTERTSPSSEIAADSIALRQGPLPLNIAPARILLDAVDGLPGISYFQFDLLGGTVNGSLNLTRDSGDFRVRSALNFSGINTAAFFPGLYSGKDDPRAEVRGMVYLDMPVTARMPTLLENTAFSVEFTKIGSRAIERLLYALDPYESNEAVMAQRRILKNGSPKWIRIDIRDGFLSVQGEATVKTLTIPLPSIQRLNIARLPGIEKFASYIGPMETAAELMDRLSSETLVVSPKGQMIMFR